MNYLRTLLDILVTMGEDTTPCECEICCPYYKPDEGQYCESGDCIGGMIEYIKQIISEEEVK